MRIEKAKQLKVCMVTSAFPRWPNDSRGPFILETARALSSCGAEVRVITMHAPGAKTCEYVENIEVIRVPYLWPEAWQILQQDGGGLPSVWRTNWWARLVFLPYVATQVLATMQYAKGYDVLHAHWTLSAGVAWASQWYHQCPYVVTVHGSDIFQAPNIPLVGQLTRLWLRHAQRIIAVSHGLAEATTALGIPAGQLEVIPNGIDLKRFQPGPLIRDPLVLFVGSLIERKGLRFLLMAMQQMLQSLPDYHLAVVGSGPQEAELKQLARSLGIAEHVQFVGSQSQAQISQWMQRAQLFVLPSLEEAFGVVLLEAMASGTPCIGTRVGGIPEIISSDAGCLVPAANSEALAKAMMALLGTKHWPQLSQNARRFVETHCYTWEKVAARLLEIYSSVL